MNDDRFRELLLDAVPPVDDREWAREQIGQRVRTARRRRRALQGFAAALTGLAIVAASALMLSREPANIPIIGDLIDDRAHADQVLVSTACGDAEVAPDLAAFLERWTDGRVPGVDEPCLLAAVEGPEPAFDTSGLGTEQVWEPDPPAGLAEEITASTEDTEDWDPADDDLFPIVYLGTLPELEYEYHLGRVVQFTPDGIVSDRVDPTGYVPGSGLVEGLVTSSTQASGGAQPAGEEYDYLLVLDRVQLVTRVPDETAAVQLRIGSDEFGWQVSAWQRPRARVAAFGLVDLGVISTDQDSGGWGSFDVRVVAFGTTGDVLAEYDPFLDLP